MSLRFIGTTGQGPEPVARASYAKGELALSTHWAETGHALYGRFRWGIRDAEAVYLLEAVYKRL